MKPETALKRARAGAAFLDEKFGRGWRRKIRRRRLNMASGAYRPSRGSCGCILAQLDAQIARDDTDWPDRTGYYSDGVERFKVTAPVKLGFIADSRVSDDDNYANLTKAWRKVLSEG